MKDIGSEYCSLYRAWRFLAFNEKPVEERAAKYHYQGNYSQEDLDKAAFVQTLSLEKDLITVAMLEAHKRLTLEIFHKRISVFQRKDECFVILDLPASFLDDFNLDITNSSLYAPKLKFEELFVLKEQLFDVFGLDRSNSYQEIPQPSKGKPGRKKQFDYGRYAAVLTVGILEGRIHEKESQNKIVNSILDLASEIWPDEEQPSPTTLEDNLVRNFISWFPAIKHFANKKSG